MLTLSLRLNSATSGFACRPLGNLKMKEETTERFCRSGWGGPMSEVVRVGITWQLSLLAPVPLVRTVDRLVDLYKPGM